MRESTKRIILDHGIDIASSILPRPLAEAASLIADLHLNEQEEKKKKKKKRVIGTENQELLMTSAFIMIFEQEGDIDVLEQLTEEFLDTLEGTAAEDYEVSEECLACNLFECTDKQEVLETIVEPMIERLGEESIQVMKIIYLLKLRT